MPRTAIRGLLIIAFSGFYICMRTPSPSQSCLTRDHHTTECHLVSISLLSYMIPYPSLIRPPLTPLWAPPMLSVYLGVQGCHFAPDKSANGILDDITLRGNLKQAAYGGDKKAKGLEPSER